jgi:hypothetical protein
MIISQELILISVLAGVYILSFFYTWKILCTQREKTGSNYTRLSFAGKILSMNFLYYVCLYLLYIGFVFITTQGHEYGGSFAVMILTMFALFIYPVQAFIIFIVSLLLFPFAKSRFDHISMNKRVDSINLMQLS